MSDSDNNNNNNDNNNDKMEIIDHRFPDKNPKNLELFIKNLGWIESKDLQPNEKIIQYIKEQLNKDKQEIAEMVCIFFFFV